MEVARQPSPIARAVDRLRRAFRDDVVEARDRRAVRGVGAFFAITAFAFAFARYACSHQRTFDLAFYTRLLWGAAVGDAWEPIVDAHAYGLHFVWFFSLFRPLGLVAPWLGVIAPPLLLAIQSLSLGATVVPLSRIGARTLGRPGVYLGALALVLHPNVFHVATVDMHPGTAAVLPIAWMLDALARKNADAFAIAGLAVLGWREDLALLVIVGGLALLVLGDREDRRARGIALGVTLGSALYLAAFLFYFHPRYAPAEGSFALHFGAFGANAREAIVTIVTEPSRLVAHLSTGERLLYVPLVTAATAFLALAGPEWLLLAAPLLAMNLLSSFPTTLFLDSHYLTPVVPYVVVAALHGAARVVAIADRTVMTGAWAAALLGSHVVAGGSPLAWAFDRHAFVFDGASAAADVVLDAIPDTASVQAPDAMLAHLAARRVVRRAPPPEATTAYLVLDAAVRVRERHRETLLRTDEEPWLRSYLARDDLRLVAARGPYLALERAPTGGAGLAFVREGMGFRSSVVAGQAIEGRALTGCVRLVSATVNDESTDEGVATLILTLSAERACDSDLALRIGWGYRPGRVDLIAEGWVSPAHFAAGDRITSRHALDARELAAIEGHGLRVGALRESGARPEPHDPAALDVPLSGR